MVYKITKAKLHVLMAIIILIGFNGCSVSSLNPFAEIPQKETRHVFIPCKIEYDGDKAYLPEYLRENESSKCKAHYHVKTEEYDESSFLDWMNPFYPFGYSFGDKGNMITGEINICDGDEYNQTMSSSCKLKKKYSFFQDDENEKYDLELCQNKIKEDLNNNLLIWKKNQQITQK